MRAALALAPCMAAALALLPPAPGRLRELTGQIELSSPIEVTGADVEIRGIGTTVLRPAADFRGSALIVCRGCTRLRVADLLIEGNREAPDARADLPPSDVPFARFTARNGILLEGACGAVIERVGFRAIAGFAVLASRSRDVRIRGVVVRDSGSRNARGRNNATGGILLEEGTARFRVEDSRFERVLGNGVWTHSLYTSPRNGPGRIARNRFVEIGRDAIQVGHATGVRVEDNLGERIGYPFDAVDIASGATPVGVDTAGNVDAGAYVRNRFREVNGKCIDLDGFHDGLVAWNECVNGGRAEDYPHGHYGIVVNNWNPDMRSERITIADNLIDGSKFGGIFLIGSRHTLVRNRLRNLNLARCNESAARFGCVAIQGEPDVLQAGIYLGRVAAEWAGRRADASRGHVIRDNLITGHQMAARCVLAAPGVSVAASDVGGNDCRDTEPPPLPSRAAAVR